MRKLLDDFANDSVLLTNGAVLAVGQTGLGAGGRLTGNIYQSMAHRLTLGSAAGLTGLGQRAVGISPVVAGGGNHSGFHLNLTASRADDAVALDTVGGAGFLLRRNCGLGVVVTLQLDVHISVLGLVVVVKILGINTCVANNSVSNFRNVGESTVSSLNLKDTAGDGGLAVHTVIGGGNVNLTAGNVNAVNTGDSRIVLTN